MSVVLSRSPIHPVAPVTSTNSLPANIPGETQTRLVKQMPAQIFHRLEQPKFSSALLTVFMCKSLFKLAGMAVKIDIAADRTGINWNKHRIQVRILSGTHRIHPRLRPS